MRIQRYDERMALLRDVYGDKIPKDISSLARARRANDVETIKMLESRVKESADRAMRNLQ